MSALTATIRGVVADVEPISNGPARGFAVQKAPSGSSHALLVRCGDFTVLADDAPAVGTKVSAVCTAIVGDLGLMSVAVLRWVEQ